MDGTYVQHVERDHLLSLPRLLNNRMLELRQQFLSRPKKNRETMVNLRQSLFGSSDKKENLTFAQEEMNKLTQADSQRWNFDIDAGKPMEGQYHWKLMQQTNQALDTSGRLTCLTTFGAASSNTSPSCGSSSGFATSSKNLFASTPSSSSSSSSLSSSPNKRAITTTTFSTTTTPTAVISKKCVKRLQKSAPINKVVPKLITDYFKESKPVSTLIYKGKDLLVAEEKDSVSNRLVEILKIRSMNVR